MQENRISIKITPAQLQTGLDAVKTLNENFGAILIALSMDERKTLPKMNDGRLPFVQKALEYSKTNQQFVPSYIDLKELQIDLEAAKELFHLLHPLAQFVSNLNDTAMLSGSEAYVAALAFYNSVKQAVKMKVPGAETIYNDLSVLFARGVKRNGEESNDKQD